MPWAYGYGAIELKSLLLLLLLRSPVTIIQLGGPSSDRTAMQAIINSNWNRKLKQLDQHCDAYLLSRRGLLSIKCSNLAILSSKSMSSKERCEHENQNHYEKNQLVLSIKTEQRLNWNLLNYVIVAIWRENMLGYLSADIISYKKRTVFESAALTQLKENCELQGTDNVQGQISEHIFAPNGDYCLYYPSNLFRNARSFENWGIFSDILQLFPSFSWGIFDGLYLMDYYSGYILLNSRS